MKDFYIYHRIFVETNKKNANVISKNFIKLFSKPISNLSVKEYYKIEGWYEISFKTLEKNSIPNKSLEENTKVLGQGWEYILGNSDEDFSGSAVWNFGENNKFIEDSVKFADVGVYLP